jgi:hypothetical protein
MGVEAAELRELVQESVASLAERNLAYHQYQHDKLKSGYINVLGLGWCSIPVAAVHFVLDVLQATHARPWGPKQVWFSSLHRWQALGFLFGAPLKGVGAGAGADAVSVSVGAVLVDEGAAVSDGRVEVDADANIDASEVDDETEYESKVDEHTYWNFSSDLRNCSQV